MNFSLSFFFSVTWKIFFLVLLTLSSFQYRYLRALVSVCVCACMCVCMCTCVCMCACMRACPCVRVHVHACVCCCFSHVQLSITPWTVAHQPPLSMGFSRQEYWCGLPCPPLGDLLDPGIEPVSPATPALQEDSLLLSHWGSPTSKHLRLKTSFCTHLSLEIKGLMNAISDWKKNPVY